MLRRRRWNILFLLALQFQLSDTGCMGSAFRRGVGQPSLEDGVLTLWLLSETFRTRGFSVTVRYVLANAVRSFVQLVYFDREAGSVHGRPFIYHKGSQ